VKEKKEKGKGEKGVTNEKGELSKTQKTKQKGGQKRRSGR